MHKSILPALIAVIGGMTYAVGQSPFNSVTSQGIHNLAFTPTERPSPQRTQGGGSRNYETPSRISNFISLSAINS